MKVEKQFREIAKCYVKIVIEENQGNKLMDPISQKTVEIINEAGKEAISLVINKTTGDNHPEYEKAVILGTAEAIKEIAKFDIETATKIYDQIKIKRQQRDFFNISKVLHKFASLIKIKPKEKITDDNDFFWNTIEYAKSVSNEEIQDLIAKIIAGEYIAPGAYSMHTLQILKMLGKSELELFEKICTLLVNKKQIPQELFSLPDSAKNLMEKIGIDFESLQTLQSLGLFLPNHMAESPIQNPDNKNFELIYFDKIISFISINESNSTIRIPSFYGLSMVGEQILKHINPQYNEEYFSWLKENYKIPNYKVI